MLYLRPEGGWRDEEGGHRRKESPPQQTKMATPADPGEEQKHRDREIGRDRVSAVQDKHRPSVRKISDS